MLEREGLAVKQEHRIAKRPGSRQGEASFAQRRIWVKQMLDRESTAYNILLALKIDGRLSYAGASQSLQVIVDRHEALRTCFKIVQGRPHQTVQPQLQANLAYVDLGDLGESGDQLGRLLASKQRTSFSLERPPLFDFTLVRVGSEVNVLLIALHHIIFDFVSSQILFDEFGRLYVSCAEGVPCPLPKLRIQYLDFSDWQRRQFEKSSADENLKLWRESIGIGDEIPILDLPADRPSLREAAFEPSIVKFDVLPELARQVKRMSDETGLSKFCIWLAAFQILLHRYTDSDEVLLCVPHLERNDPDLENVIGFFLNLLVVRLRVRRQQSFRSILRAVHRDYLEAITNRDYPFDKLVEALSPHRHQGLTKLGEVGLTYQMAGRSQWELGGLSVSFLDVNVPIAKAEMWLTIYENPDNCQGCVEFNGARYSGQMVEGMTEHYCGLLSNLLNAPERPVGSVLTVTPPESQAALHDDRSGQAPPADCLTANVQERSRALPDKTALVMGGDHVSYGGLNRRANQVARYLMRNEVGLQSPVGLLQARDVDAYICILAILKSGAVYVPMDRAHPTAYLMKMIETADIGHLLVSEDAQRMREAVAGLPVRVLEVAEICQKSRSEDGSDLALPLSSEQTAYVCFTSGSTGESKAAFVAHGPIAAHLRSFGQCVPIESSDRVLQFAALTFDVSIEQIFSAWSAGATLLPRGDDAWSVQEFIDFLDAQQVTVANLPTAYWNQVVKISATAGMDIPRGALRCMLVGGEAMRAETARLWRRMSAPGIRFINAYGPTESVITATLHQVKDLEALEAGASVPIGSPLPGREAYVVDSHGFPVPTGVPGELCMRGFALADGYLKSPRLSATQFLPIADEGAAGRNGVSGTRMYRTGDWVRRLADGSLEFLQRKDDEVKIRGVRVRPGLIESVILGNSRIVEGAVVVRQSTFLQDDSNGFSAPDDESAWREMLALLPESFIKRSIESEEADQQGAPESPGPIEAGSQGETLVMSRHEPEFDLSLKLKRRDFISTPRGAQRNWVINRALEECAQDLRELNELTRRFVAGSERVEIGSDLFHSDPGPSQSELVLDGHQVMQDWQRPLMRELARAVTEGHGDILEIGFGMGLSASYIQEQAVRSHIIIEANEKVVQAARRWRERHSERRIQIVHAKWQQVIEELEGFDGILFDTYPMTENEFRSYVLRDVTFAEHFFPFAAQLLRPGGAFTYYSNEIDSLSRRHQRSLLKHFSSFRVDVVRNLKPPVDSQNWWADSLAVVRAYKK